MANNQITIMKLKKKKNKTINFLKVVDSMPKQRKKV